MKQRLDQAGEPLRPLSQWAFNENPHCREMTLDELWEWTGKRDTYRHEYVNAWNATATGVDAHGDPVGCVDVILTPVAPGVAPLLDHSHNWLYTSIWNLLDYPAVSFPVTHADAGLDPRNDLYTPQNKLDAENHHLCEPYNQQSLTTGRH